VSNLFDQTVNSAPNEGYYATIVGFTDLIINNLLSESETARSLTSALATAGINKTSVNFGAGSKMLFLVSDDTVTTQLDGVDGVPSTSDDLFVHDTGIWLWSDSGDGKVQPSELTRVGTLKGFGAVTDFEGTIVSSDLASLTSDNFNILTHSYVDPTLTCTCG
jgi:hypothetical protein